MLQRDLDPDSVLFLGDLFDGGREWSTSHEGFTPSEKQWKKYGHNFWLNEYERFGRIFFDPDQISGGFKGREQKRVIATLPGNHDLGFGRGIQPATRNRFHAYFGEGDRVDVIGNHTFISLDAVSLSAMDDPEASPAIWNRTMLFLDNVQPHAQRVLQHELNCRHGLEAGKKFSHEAVVPEKDVRVQQLGDRLARHQLPTVVLSHVPFYREPGTPCGPLREKYPPSAPNLDNDERNAIQVAGGYQYQNVLSREITKTVASKIGNIGYVFSGDDHDYCELTHHAYPSAGSGIHETTVKSLSWAMGVRRPGFVLASLWHPINEYGRGLPDGTGNTNRPTIQTHLCLLPDQLGIFIRYGICAVVSILILLLHSLIMALRERDTIAPGSPLLPTREKPLTPSTSSRADGNNLLAPRSSTARARSVSPGIALGGYGLSSTEKERHVPLMETAVGYGYRDDEETDDWGYDTKRKAGGAYRRRTFVAILGTQVRGDFAGVLGPVLLWYWWIMRSG
ncbi:hypothetical protein MBLNU457_5065t2 [Dothideomycetes sp. NU457]